VCCSVLQRVAVCCSVLQCVAVCWSVLQCVAVCCSVLQCVATCCTVLQCVAVCCTVLHCVALCCSALQYCNVLQRVRMRCRVFQWGAVWNRLLTVTHPCVWHDSFIYHILFFLASFVFNYKYEWCKEKRKNLIWMGHVIHMGESLSATHCNTHLFFASFEFN